MYFVLRNQGHPQEQPLPTWFLYFGMAYVLGTILLFEVVSRRMVRGAKAKPTEESRSERSPIKVIWYVVNISLVALGLREGYISTAPEQLRRMNPDAVLCGILLVGTPFFALGCVNYSVRRWNVERLRRPSLDRNPLNWWFDPLQSLFISTCSVAAMAIGGLVHRPTGSVAFWTVATYFCITLGLVIGQILVYRLYRNQVVAATD
jgi:hypothetical protein